MAVYSTIFMTAQSQKNSAFTLYRQIIFPFATHHISDYMFQSHAQVDDNPTLHISLNMRWPDLCSCGWPLALFLQQGKKYHIQQKLNRREGLLLRKLSNEIGLGLANWLHIIATLSPSMCYQVTTTLMYHTKYHHTDAKHIEIRYSERHKMSFKPLPASLYVSWRARGMGSLGSSSDSFEGHLGLNTVIPT